MKCWENMEPDPMFFITSEGPVTGGWGYATRIKSDGAEVGVKS